MLKCYVSLHSYLSGLLHRDDRGATAVEYGLLVALIAVVIIAAVTAIGLNLQTTFQNVANKL